MSELQSGTVKIEVTVRDKIGLPKFSSVEIGASLTKIVPEGTEDELTQTYSELFSYLEDTILSAERAKILDEIQTEGASE